MNERRILLVTNGFGEMAIMECIARAIRAKRQAVVLTHFPLVGRVPPESWPQPIGPRAEMPSGGLVTYWNFGNIARDVRAGLIGVSLRQFAFLARQRGKYQAVVAIGDIYCLAACLAFARNPTIFVATAKSEYVAPHSALECAIAKHARMTFARDAMTAAALARRGVRARYAGNVMMDGVSVSEALLPVDKNALRVAVLPGSRDDAPGNMFDAARRLARIAELGGRRVQAFVAVAPTLGVERIAGAIGGAGIAIAATGADSGVVARGASKGVSILLVRGAVGDVLRAADIVLGQAGTGNEQAAGLGKPVVAAAKRGSSPQRIGWYRMRQQRLLGTALLVISGDDDDGFAREVLRLLDDPARMAAMGAEGRARMGDPGAASAVADSVLALADERT